MKSIQQSIQVPFHYAVYFTRRLFSLENRLLERIIEEDRATGRRKLLFVIDRGVADLHPQLIESIEQYGRCRPLLFDLTFPPLILEGGEGVKNDPSLVNRLHGEIERAGLCRHSYIVAVGGGALLDLVGYAAATAHRGIRLIRVPTTVLSQGDSGVGVKNGINAFGKKNFLGTFSPPFAVINDLDFLTTLSDRDWRSGLAEAVKAALIRDRPFFDQLESDADRLAARDQNAIAAMEAMERTIRRSAEIHLRHIAGGDPFELGSSRPLDFGHWAAHKLEVLSDHTLRHGEAVSVGIALDTTYSYLSGPLPKASWERIIGLLSALGLPCYRPELKAPALFQGLTDFREHLGGPLTVMLLQEIGRGIEVHEMDETLLREGIALLEQIDFEMSNGGLLWKNISMPTR